MSIQSRLAATAAASLIASSPVLACSRVTYIGPDNTVLTGRSMDWMVPLHSNLWVFPEGLERNGADGRNSLTWTSKYGSVVTAAYDAATTDGMNEKGLVASLLYLSSAEYSIPDPAKRALSIAGWPQYVLDTYATVDEAVAGLEAAPFQVLPPAMPGGYAPTMHLAISDASGDSAIFEYIHGKLVVHHSKLYAVMTNEPAFDQQLALDAYWKDIGGAAMLPGTDRPADRFVRASYYLSQAPQTSDPLKSVAAMFSIIRDVSVPMGVTKPGSPNIAPTLWRTVSDQKSRQYYFESTSSPNIFWVDMSKLNLAAGQPTETLNVDSGEFYAGETSARFKPATAFDFLPVAR
ncbi:penicillin amidase [Roseiarcus fermentans]|uniref:Penicillin amidase n=1 Tax=Roseiarcus fermentans TaxID=1473586 RepID=A0A366F7H5_9HYPH|nr:linear amide C-N hydrolase [Roseiarcus fermentans]RBP09665.1 penicillin amidase [Roseiarcus fermentans]